MVDLLPGDHLLYSGKGFWSRAIRIKTFSRFSHVELYLGNNQTFTSREGEGVKIYNYTDNNLAVVMRPVMPFNLKKGMPQMLEMLGQGYDYWGLLRFFTLGKQSTNKQFCSEAVLRADRACGFDPISREIDADLTAPGTFFYSTLLQVVWDVNKPYYNELTV